MKRLVRFSLMAVLMLSLLLALGCAKESTTDNDDQDGAPDELPVATESMIIDHQCRDLEYVPLEWISKAKTDLHIAYGHTSHGSQITTGMSGLVTFASAPNGGSTYAWNNGGTDGELDLRDSPFSGASDLGNPNRTAWATATRTYLDAHSDVNVIMWSWCGQADGSEADINTYLDLMSDLEKDYPGVKFVYMTGHTNGSGLTGNLHLRNQQIRDYCSANKKILFDFEDIESYDPDGKYFGDKYVTDGCNYDYNNSGSTTQSGDPAEPTNGDRNWASDWQNAHPGEWFNCSAAHTKALNGNLKAYAAWWMWARMAGWNGGA